MTPDERAAVDRFIGSLHDLAASRLRLTAAMIDMTESMHRFSHAFQQSEIREVQSHPDLAELDAQLDGYYS